MSDFLLVINHPKSLVFILYIDLVGAFLSKLNFSCYLDKIYINRFCYLSFLPNKEK